MTLTKKEKQDKFNTLWKENKFTELREHLFEWLKEKPEGDWNNHWQLAQIAETFYLQKHFDQALEYAEKAWKLAPHCPMTIWEYSECLNRTGRYLEAEPLYRNIIRRGVNRVAFGECGEGIRAARTLVNDCRYGLSLDLADRGEFKLAVKYLKQHIANRNQNCKSLFRLREVKKDLADVQQGVKPSFHD